MPRDRRAGWTRTSGRAASVSRNEAHDRGSWQIRDLFVLPTHRRLGVGRALLASVREAAIASGALRLVLHTEDDNDPALRLYADSGYAPIKGYCSLKLPLGPEPR